MEGSGTSALQSPVDRGRIADADTALAMYTLAGIVGDIRVILELGKLFLDGTSGARIITVLNLIFVAEGLKLADSVSRTAHAVNIVIRQNKPEHFFSVEAYPLRLGIYDHALSDLCLAGSQKIAVALYLHHAQTAGAYIAYPLKITKRWDIYAGRLCRFQDRGVLLCFYNFSVNSNIDHKHLPPTIEPQP